MGVRVGVEEGVGVGVDSDTSEVSGVGVAVLSGDEGTSETEASVLLSEEFVPSGEGAEVVLPSPTGQKRQKRQQSQENCEKPFHSKNTFFPCFRFVF